MQIKSLNNAAALLVTQCDARFYKYVIILLSPVWVLHSLSLRVWSHLSDEFKRDPLPCFNILLPHELSGDVPFSLGNLSKKGELSQDPKTLDRSHLGPPEGQGSHNEG